MGLFNDYEESFYQAIPKGDASTGGFVLLSVCLSVCNHSFILGLSGSQACSRDTAVLRARSYRFV